MKQNIQCTITKDMVDKFLSVTASVEGFTYERALQIMSLAAALTWVDLDNQVQKATDDSYAEGVRDASRHIHYHVPPGSVLSATGDVVRIEPCSSISGSGDPVDVGTGR